MASIQTLDVGARRERHAVRYKDETGRHRSKTFRLKSEAKAFQAEAIQAERRRATLASHGIDLGGDRETTTVMAWVDRWLEEYQGKEGDLADSTRGKWRSAVNVGLRPHAARHLRLPAFRRAEIEQVLDSVTSPHTRKILHQALALCLDGAVRQRLIASNPAREVRVPTVRRKRKPEALTDPQVTKVFARLREPWLLMSELQLWTGARPGEAIAWQPRDLIVRKNRSYLRIVRTVTKDGRGYKSVKTGEDGEREIPVPAALAGRLRARIDGLGLPADGEQPLFPGRNTVRPIDRANFTKRVWNPAIEAAGLRGVVWYDLRHTCVSRLIARGADIVRVARWIGHTKPTTTLREYGHMFPQGLDELADLLTE